MPALSDTNSLVASDYADAPMGLLTPVVAYLHCLLRVILLPPICNPFLQNPIVVSRDILFFHMFFHRIESWTRFSFPQIVFCICGHR